VLAIAQNTVAAKPPGILSLIADDAAGDPVLESLFSWRIGLGQIYRTLHIRLQPAKS